MVGARAVGPGSCQALCRPGQPLENGNANPREEQRHASTPET